MGSIKHLIMLLAILALGAGGYYLATTVDMFKSAATTAAEVQEKAAELQRDVLKGLAELDQVKLNGSMFVSPEFTALKPQPVVLPPEGYSRPDPFAPYK